MNLFLAFLPDESTTEYALKIQQKLGKYSESGRLTSEKNLHVTLVYIGEVNESQLEEVKNVLAKVKKEPLTIHLDKVSFFDSKGRGNVYFITVISTKELQQTYDDLLNDLNRQGLMLPKISYRPHMTLGRKIVVKEKAKQTNFTPKESDQIFIANKICLMESVRIGEELVYKEIAFKELK